MRALEPEAYLAKGSLELGGLFLRAPDKNYVLMRLDAPGDYPYEIIYHEYTHLILGKAGEWMPLWLNEGIAQFYETTVIHDKDVVMGYPTKETLYVLRENHLLPLQTLLTVDHNSPYYHQEDKGSIFYAQSWALTHYLIITDWQQHTHRLTDYTDLVMQKVDSLTAATRVFGDLNQLQKQLNEYLGQYALNHFTMPFISQIDESAFKVQPVPTPQADAYRADFLAYNGREKDARDLLDQVLHDDPSNALAHETMGYLAFKQGQMEEARKWYEQAVKLDSQSYLAHYYFAAMAMSAGPMSPETAKQVETSLKAAIKLNPGFAPPYDRLAVFYETRRENLDEAHLMSLQAVQLDPANVGYRVNAASVLISMEQYNNAKAVLQNALKIATNPGEIATIQNEIGNIEGVMESRKDAEERNTRIREEMKTQFATKPAAETSTAADAEDSAASPALKRDESLHGPHVSERGTIKNVTCSYPSNMDFDFDTGGHTISLHSANYYKIPFSTLNFTAKPEFDPCSDLEGTRARVEYVAPSGNAKSGGIVAIEIMK
jgi:Tfp pilus assembly protein PilF